jgi:hypothetical protein
VAMLPTEIRLQGFSRPLEDLWARNHLHNLSRQMLTRNK